MNRVVPISRLASTEVHDQFLSSLAACFTADTGGATGFNNGFTITTSKIPQSACVSISTGMSRSGGTSGIKINGNNHTDAKVTAETAGS